MEGEPIQRRPLKVLLIDQFEADRAKLLQHLKSASQLVECIEASDGKAGLDLFKTLQPDCVVMELKYADLIGIEILDRLNAETNGKTVPIFVWTCLTHEMLKRAAAMLGVHGYFIKSVGSHAQVAQAILAAMEDA